MTMKNIENFILEKTSFPLKDRHDLPSSSTTFEGGAHYRMEIPGIENAENFEVLVKEAAKYKMPIHRVIGTVGGSALLDKQELKYYAQIGAEAKIEALVNPAPTRGWDTGRQYLTAEGYVSGMRIRGQDNLYLWLKEFNRCLEAGLRGFLIPDEGLLYLLNKMRADGAIPADVKFKVSVFAGHGNAVGGKLLEELGADSFNPLADLSLAMFAAIRSVTNIPLDVYMSIVDSMGGNQRHIEADEIARICAPVYFKFEPGKNECDLYNSWHDSDHLNHLVKVKVKMAQICKEWVEDSGKKLIFNDYKEDLAIPKP
ncbi:hypothetical protein [Alkaliphilus peptidifermentans]|uniref:Uncharacterized protein n=1 Tax=Alkaliphilus peptidifermentans DSM 18978 TaxID=1120976 RepID=A0A1G5JTT0_9FIRM|nr:hypothetical protein [Alkaliphilus peptidifermentans]SCY91059.1 hypothetical protein SAMN03080606_03006 [Alkaliphilus peptidifermentans DSM 18978]